ncbi:hypothetical protein [Cupriavidus sp. DF5525]|uniref:hypothetical protein n=1 Tax=Cupriavidus sp. DF5525 TaxID=3160989 RepID=UPI0032E02F5C
MALELLAGPFDIKDASGAILAGLPTYGNSFYDDDVGFYAGALLVVQLDGRAYRRASQESSSNFTLDLQNPGEYLIHESLTESRLYKFNKRSGTIGEIVVDSAVTNYVAGTQVRTPDRYLNVSGTNVRYKPLTLVGGWTYEASLTGDVSGPMTVSRTRDANVLAIAFGNGTVLFYDWVQKRQVSGAVYVGANAGVWYSPRHDIYVALASDKLKVFASTPRPATLSNPVAVTPLVKGRASVLKARALGSNSEPCPGELVDWSLTGPGSLAIDQSMTDGDGWAWNTYVAPMAAGGSPVIGAELRF